MLTKSLTLVSSETQPVSLSICMLNSVEEQGTDWTQNLPAQGAAKQALAPQLTPLLFWRPGAVQTPVPGRGVSPFQAESLQANEVNPIINGSLW